VKILHTLGTNPDAASVEGANDEPEISVAQVERWASALGGAALAAYGSSGSERRSLAATMLAAAGGGLIYRSATGYRTRPGSCPRCLIKTSSWAGLRDGGVDQPLRLFGDDDVARHRGRVDAAVLLQVRPTAIALRLIARAYDDARALKTHLTRQHQAESTRSPGNHDGPAVEIEAVGGSEGARDEHGAQCGGRRERDGLFASVHGRAGLQFGCLR